MKQIGEQYPSFQLLVGGEEVDLIKALETLRDQTATAINDLIVGASVNQSAEWKSYISWNTNNDVHATYVNLGSLPNAATTTTAHGVTGIDTVIRLWGMASDGAGKDYPLPNEDLALFRDGANLKVTTSSDFSGYTGWAVLEYTKT